VDENTTSCDPDAMKARAIAAVLMVPAILSCEGQPSGIAPCAVPPGVRSTAKQSDMPRPLQEALQQKAGVIVPPGSPFDSTDVVRSSPPHFRRLIFIWNKGERWIIATEKGGFVYNDPIFSYKVDANGGKATLLSERTAQKNTVCSTAEDLLKN
jgi:hypothetical protein